jgi:hypothetical protein
MPQKDEIEYNLLNKSNSPDIFGFTETFLGDDTTDDELDINNLIFHTKERTVKVVTKAREL